MGITDETSEYTLCAVETPNDWLLLEEEHKSPYRGGHVFSNILGIAERIGCKTVLVERNYIDYEYRDEFSFLYSKAFKNYGSYCTRLHLFGNRYTKIKEIENQEVGKLEYLGYTVVRPTSVGKVGRTVIPPKINNPDKEYYLCIAPFKTHLFGKELTILGTPFIQQDTMVMRCAQACMWMVLRFMEQTQDFSRCSPSDITLNATKHLSLVGPTVPSDGLTAQQVVNALNNLGFSPILFSKNQFTSAGEEWEPIKLAHEYLESQIPVIAVVPNHVVTIIGHTFDHKPSGLREIVRKKNIISSSHWVSAFFVHDDALGPYRLLPSPKYKAEKDLDLVPPKEYLYKNTDDIRNIIVPLPPKVYYRALDVETTSHRLIADGDFLSYVRQEALQGNQTALEFLSSLQLKTENPLVVRSYFMLSEKYKRILSDEPLCEEMAPTLCREYKNMRMPRFVWISEITNVRRLSKEKEVDRTIFGEILIDATAARYGPAWLAIHMPGNLFLQDPLTDEGRHIPIPDDNPYRLLSRQPY